MGVLTKEAAEMSDALGAVSMSLATRRQVDDGDVAAVGRVRDAVASMTLSEQDEVDPRLYDLLQNGLLRAWQADTMRDDDPAAARRSMRIAVEQVRQSLAEIAEARPVSESVPAKDVARWVDRTSGVSRDDLAGLVGVSARTWGRWTAEGGTEPSGGDEMRLRTVARTVAHLRHVLTGPGVVAWMRRPHPQLDGRTPVDLLDDPEGGARVVSLAASTRSQVAS